jgi:hypothetical protein
VICLTKMLDEGVVGYVSHDDVALLAVDVRL